MGCKKMEKWGNSMQTIEELEEAPHVCCNVRFGFDCVCDWVEKHPGDKEFTCEFCGLYVAGEARCNHCEIDDPYER